MNSAVNRQNIPTTIEALWELSPQDRHWFLHSHSGLLTRAAERARVSRSMASKDVNGLSVSERVAGAIEAELRLLADEEVGS